MKKLLSIMLMLACSVGMWAQAPTHVVLVGGATAAGWTDNDYYRTPGEMIRTDADHWVWAGYLTTAAGDAGRFKIPHSLKGWDGYWAPSQDYVLGIEEADLSTDGKDDYKFRVAEEGMYKITLNTNTKKIKAEKLTEPQKDGDFYLLATANDLTWFAGYVSSQNESGKAKLTADISFQNNQFYPIACDRRKFKGELDGQGHTIDYIVIDHPEDRVGLCRYFGPGANIHDLTIGGNSSIKARTKAGGIVGHARDGGEVKLTNLINMATVQSDPEAADANAAGLVACATDGTKITALNCANTGKISGKNGECAAFAGWTVSGTTFTNCWNTGDLSGLQGMDGGKYKRLFRGDATSSNCFDLEDDQATKISQEDVASGKLCYLLNGNQTTIGWYQTLSEPKDAHPVPSSNGHLRVYGNGALNCDGSPAGGELTYSNSNESVIPPHTNENGWCVVCGTLDKEYLAPIEGYYQIGTANELKWFAQYVVDVNGEVKAKLTADIDYRDNNNGFIGVPGKPFKGEFDGQEHTITIAITNKAGVGRTGLFAAIDGATIKNLVVEGTASSNDQNCVGGLGGRSDGASVVENVVVKTAVSYTGSNGDATCGGFFANMEGSATLKNCAFLGSINTGSSNGNGGLVGWAGGGQNNKYTNCLVAPTAFDETKGDKIARNNPTKTNCHFVAADDARLASGELCYLLNNKVNGGTDWYQNLTGEAKDPMPFPFDTHAKVYGNGKLHCDGTAYEGSEIVYGNTNEQQKDEHDIQGGFCNYCNIMTEYVENYMTPAADGWYEISNNKQMRWFAAKVKTYRVASNDDSNARINARLMNDIDFEGVTDYKPIGGLWGQGNARYAGEFDGQFHKITNLKIDLDQDNVGIFGVIAEGAVIKNFTVDASCSIKGKGHVGIVGEAWRSHAGEFHLICLGNEADITGTGNNVGGILGVNMNNGGYAKCNMCQCYSTGKIVGAGENGQLSGWTGDGAYIENCYAIGEMTNCDGFARLGNGSTAKNCYSDKDLTWGPTKITNEMLTTGELCYRLGDVNFRQEIGTDNHPVLSDTKPNVFGVTVGNIGYATCVIKGNTDFTKWGVQAYKVVAIEEDKVALEEVTTAIAGDAVIVKAEEGLYFSNPVETATTVGDNKLIAVTEEVTADGTQYALAKKNEKTGFYKVANDQKIPVGKAYLVIPGPAGVKAFYGFDEVETAINNIEEALQNDAAIYNISGQRLSKMQKGINIINGKKILF